MKLFGTSKINALGHLEIGGCDALELAERFGTPLYVMDETLIRNQCRLFKSIAVKEVETEVVYASKAFLNLAMCKLIKDEGLSLDVVSGGELYTALMAGFPVSRIYFHGNNKTGDELELAVKHDIGTVILDNASEFKLLEDICKKYEKTMRVFLRVNPGISAHTHEYISTTKNDSKFGVSIFSEATVSLIKEISESKRVFFKGLHCHIGSQIFEEESFLNEVSIMMSFVKTLKQRLNAVVPELNLGGGFGVHYTDEDKPFEIAAFLKKMKERVYNDAAGLNLIVPKILIEPGRAIVANAGTTLYTVGSTKTTFGMKNYVFVDGSMADNIRTALYDAKYDAALANRMNEELEQVYTITGKACESGDMLVKAVKLPEVQTGDIAAVFTTGAYNYSMASNYNRLLKPAVIFVKDGNAKIVVKRETYEDLIRNDVIEVD